MELQVALHELLGHGSGRQFTTEEADDEKAKAQFAGIVNPLTGENIASWYRPGQTWDSVFKEWASPMEECRAECVAIFLSTFKEVLDIFHYENPEDINYTNWLSMARQGITSLNMYDADHNKWMQAHCNARFVILNTLLKHGNGVLNFALDGKEYTFEELSAAYRELDLTNIELRLHKELIHERGVPAISNLLTHIQVYRATADVEAGRKFFQELIFIFIKPCLQII